jgi:release factor glutamine methyltransferase
MKFLGCKIDASKGVFKPRPETEFWVKETIKDCKLQITDCKLKEPRFLDIFAGSGCIGIAILKNIKNSKVDFVDIDNDAIEQIKINLKLNKISPKRYKIYRSNMFEKLKNKKYNFIFANPPYVAKERLWQVQESVKRKEPKISWYGSREGLKYIKKFLKEAKLHLKEGGKIFLEIDPFQKKEVEKILKKERYSNFEFFKDQFKKIRWVRIEG